MEEQQNQPQEQAVDAPNPAEASSLPQSEEHPQGVQPVEPVNVPDERVPSDPSLMNPTVTSEQQVTEPARQDGPDQNEGQADVTPNPEPAEEQSF